MSENKAAKPAANSGATGTEEKSPEEIREEIGETREELGDTVAAVAEKTDVKKQAKAKIEDVQNPAPLAIAAAVIGLLVLWRLLRR